MDEKPQVEACCDLVGDLVRSWVRDLVRNFKAVSVTGS